MASRWSRSSSLSGAGWAGGWCGVSICCVGVWSQCEGWVGGNRVEGWGWWAGGDRQVGRAADGVGGSAKLPCLIAVRWEAPHGARARVGVALVAWPGLLPAAGLYIRSLC